MFAKIIAGTRDRTPPTAKRLLIVEDAVLIAMDLAEQAGDAGWRVLGPAISVAEALDLLNGAAVDAAILDICVGADLITPVAERLHALGVPIVFGSGETGCGLLPAKFDASPTLRKPFSFADVERALTRLGRN